MVKPTPEPILLQCDTQSTEVQSQSSDQETEETKP